MMRCVSCLVAVFLIGCLEPTTSFGVDICQGDSSSLEVKSRADNRDALWSVEKIADDIGGFSHVSVAADGPPGSVYISYYDAVNGDLMWARSVNSGGNCGPGNSWLCEALVTVDDVGRYSSIAVKPSGEGVDFIVAYYDATSESLTVVEGYATDGTVTKTISVIDSGFSATDRTGVYTAIRYDSNGRAWIGYQNESYGSQVGTHRMVARYVGTGAGNCGEGLAAGAWACHDLFIDGNPQSFSSTGLGIDNLDRPAVAFYDEFQTYPVFAKFVGSGGSCGQSNTWRCFRVFPRSGDTDTGRHVVPFVGDGGLTIFYQNSSRGVLEKATYVYPVAGNCGWSNDTAAHEWQCDTIDDMDGIFIERGISVAADAAGYPIVAYQYGLDPGRAALGVSRPVASPEVGAAGNCGPGNSWHCQIIDGGSYLTEASSVSIAVGRWGKSFIASHEENEYPFPAEYNLKLGTLLMSGIFFDGFEGGDSVNWSVSIGAPAPFSITQSIDPIEIDGGATSCLWSSGNGSPGTSTQNRWLRRFHLSADHGINRSSVITSIDWAIGNATVMDVGLPTATVNLYSLASGAAFTYANMGVPIGTASILLSDSDSNSFVNIPVTGLISDPVSTDLVVEFVTPNGSTPPDLWVLEVGQNGAGETQDSYLAAADCFWDEPTSFQALGVNNQMIVLTVNGVEEAQGN